MDDGTVSCWGKNGVGQLGNGSDTDSNVPVTVSGLTNATAITAGGLHTCALIDDGTARCWGDNGAGGLGNGSNINSSVPVTVSGLTNATAITARGSDHTCALIDDGTARCWGFNGTGQLGNGSNINSSVPVTVSGLTNATAITTGGYSTCAVIEDSTARCWGANGEGQLGNGSSIDSNVPVTVSEIP